MTRTPRNSWLARLVVGAVILIDGACESPAAPHSAQAADVPVRITAITVGTPIQTLVVEVSAGDLPKPLVFNLSVVNGVASGTIKIPPGAARVIHVTAVDDQGDVTHEGSATIDVRPGQNPPVQIKLAPRSGQVPISVTFGNFGVVVTPAAATIDLAVDKALQLSVTVTDVNGQIIPQPQVGWATSQPAVATVSASGQVLGVIDGSATIVATYEGVAGLSAITVTGTSAIPEICDGIDNNHNGTIDEGLPFCGHFVWSLTPALTTTCTMPLLMNPVIGTVTTSQVPSGQLVLQFDLAAAAGFSVPVSLDATTGAFGASGSIAGGVTADGTISGTFSGTDAFTMTISLKNIAVQATGLFGTCLDVDQTVTGTRLAN
jgi:Big-like domain-containing protein